MLRLVKNLGSSSANKANTIDTLTLSYENRVKGRVRVVSDNKLEIGLFLERGQLLMDGDVLESDSGQTIQVFAKPEQLKEGRCSDRFLFARCCYHLGNRHVPLEIGEGFVRFKQDHVLEEMLEGLGMEIAEIQAPFNPERGAYSTGHSSQHAH